MMSSSVLDPEDKAELYKELGVEMTTTPKAGSQ